MDYCSLTRQVFINSYLFEEKEQNEILDRMEQMPVLDQKKLYEYLFQAIQKEQQDEASFLKDTHKILESNYHEQVEEEQAILVSIEEEILAL